ALPLQSRDRLRVPLILIASASSFFFTFERKNISCLSRYSFCGRCALPSRPRSNGSETPASPACCASPCRVRVQCARHPRAALGTNAAPILLGTDANGWDVRDGAHRSQNGLNSQCWARALARLP